MAQLAQDFMENPKVTFAYSAAFTHYCKDNAIDNDSPTCGKVMLSGTGVVTCKCHVEMSQGNVTWKCHVEMARGCICHVISEIFVYVVE